MISVCMATYNGDKYLKEQLESILKQLSSKDEVVISDDGSTDNTFKIIESMDDIRIRFIINHGKHGYTGNFENALMHSKGDVIIMSDQDDVWVDHKVERILEDLRDSDYVTSDAIIVDQDLNVMQQSFWSVRTPGYTAFSDFMKCSYLGCCMAFKRDVLDFALPFPSNHHLCVHDYWLQLVGSFFFKVKYEKEPLVLYRRHGGNVSDAGLSKGVPIFEKIEYRLYTLWHLLLRKYAKK